MVSPQGSSVYIITSVNIKKVYIQPGQKSTLIFHWPALIHAIISISLFNVTTFISSGALLPQDLVLMVGEKDVKSSQWGQGVDSVVANQCVKMMSHPS